MRICNVDMIELRHNMWSRLEHTYHVNLLLDEKIKNFEAWTFSSKVEQVLIRQLYEKYLGVGLLSDETF